MEYIQGAELWELEEASFLNALQIAHYLYINRVCGCFNTDPKYAENAIIEKTGKLRMIDTESTVTIEGVLDPEELLRKESYILLKYLSGYLDGGNKESVGYIEKTIELLNKTRSYVKGGYESLEKKYKYAVGQFINSDKISPHLRILFAYELGLFKDKRYNLNFDIDNPRVYLERMQMYIALASEMGQNSEGISKCLQDAISKSNPDEVFRKYENLELIDFPDSPEFSPEEIGEIEKQKLCDLPIQTIPRDFFKYAKIFEEHQFSALVSTIAVFYGKESTSHMTYKNEEKEQFRKDLEYYNKNNEPKVPSYVWSFMVGEAARLYELLQEDQKDYYKSVFKLDTIMRVLAAHKGVITTTGETNTDDGKLSDFIAQISDLYYANADYVNDKSTYDEITKKMKEIEKPN